MAASQRLTGKNLYAEFIVNGGGTYQMSGDQTTLNVTFDTDETDMTAGSDTYSFMKPTVKRNSASLTTLNKGTFDTATWGNLLVGTEGQFNFYPEGKSSGKPKGGFPAYVKSKSPAIPHNERIVREVALSPQGGEYGTTVLDPDVHTYTP